MPNPLSYLAVSAFLVLCGTAAAAPITAEDVNTANIASIQLDAPAEKPTEPNAAIAKLRLGLE